MVVFTARTQLCCAEYVRSVNETETKYVYAFVCVID